jgi:rfaE bifunctional protein nucleotidyltransferase chain/domain
MIIKTNNELKLLRKKNSQKIIGLCHGVFDVIHEGHINHLYDSKKRCDILIVSITDDQFVKKGPNQPYNSSAKRARVLEELKSVDYVFINKEITSINLINFLKPNLYFKGLDYLKKDFTDNLGKEILAVKKNKGKVFFTKTKVLSSTKIINNLLIPWTNEQKKFLGNINKNNSFDSIFEKFEKLRNLQIDIIGEPIIDNYIYSNIIGLASKDPTLSGVVINREAIPGGVLSVAQIASLFVKKVRLFTYGNNKLIKPYLNENIELINLDIKQNIQKKNRYINNHRLQKIFQLTNFEKNLFNLSSERRIIKILKKEFTENTIICDFGIGLFENNILNYINNSKNNKYLNIQSNSINFGFNLFTKYKKNQSIKYISLDEKEWKLGTKSNHLSDRIIKSFINNKTHYSVTLGKNGSIYNSNKNFYAPVFIDKVVDTTGCGDAYFVITSLLEIINTKSALIPFLGNVYAGMHAMNLANKNIPSRIDYIKYLKSILTF